MGEVASQEERDDLLIHSPPTHFVIRQLHDRNERCWAVIGCPSGAIAEGDGRRLLMRLTQAEAQAFAASMTAGLSQDDGRLAVA